MDDITAPAADMRLVDGLSDGFALIDSQWCFRYLNPAGAELLGPALPGKSMLGCNIWDIFQDLVGSEVDQAYRRTATDKVTTQCSFFYPPLQGWFEVHAYPQDDGIAVYFLDVTERRHAQENQDSENNVLKLIATGEPLPVLLDKICRETEGHSRDGMMCSVLLLDVAEGRLRFGAAPSLPDDYNRALDGVEIGPDVGSCGTAAYLGRTVLVSDIQADRKWAGFSRLADSAGLRACTSSPILSSKGLVLGTIAMYYRQPMVPGARDRQLINLAAQVAAIAIERRQAESALQTAAGRLHATFNQAAVGMAIAGHDGRLVEANQRFVELLGYPIEELRQRTFVDLTHPDDVPATRENAARIRAGELAEYMLEKRYLRKDGGVVWCRTSVTLFKDDAGMAPQYLAAVEDITEYKNAEVALLHRERELRTLADAMPQLVWIADQTGHLVWFNRRWYDYTGSTEKQMQEPEGWHGLHDPEALPLVLERWRHSIDHGEQFEMEFRLRGSDGQYRTFLTRASPILDEQGRVRRWFGTNTDIEDLQRTRQALQDETRVLDLVNRTGQALVAQVDLPALLQQITDAATQLSGAKFGAFFHNATNADGEVLQLYTLSGAPRAAFEKFGHPRATPIFGPTFRGEDPVRIDDVTQDARYGQWAPHHGMPPGHLPVRSYLAMSVRSRSGGIIGGLVFGHPEPGVFTERSERIIAGICSQAAVAIDNARLYEAVKHGADERERLLVAERAAREEAELANTTKDEFLSTLSHELRTPVSAILGWTHILESGPCSEEETAEALEAIAGSARAQAKLIDDLLDMSRIASGKVRLDIQPLDLQAIVESVVHANRPSAEARNIRLRTVIDPQADTFNGDPDRMQQVVWNLLSNAVKFTPKDGKVDVRLVRVDSSVELSVADSGIGIDADFLPHVFDRFRQADSSFSRPHGGLGLGLSIVRQLVELHGGSIRAESAGKDQGSTFVVSLPLAAQRRVASDASMERGSVDGGVDGGSEESTSQLAMDSDMHDAVDLAGIHVLVVDDDSDARKVVQRLLERRQARVTLASSAAEALECLAADIPDAMVSDIGMPGGDGYELIAQVRQLSPEAGGKLPALALTAFARSQDRVRALMSGYQAHLAKPFEAQELLATLGSLVGRI